MWKKYQTRWIEPVCAITAAKSRLGVGPARAFRLIVRPDMNWVSLVQMARKGRSERVHGSQVEF
jgi:hypothetical protein